jgi:protein-tyrosine phosphatase
MENMTPLHVAEGKHLPDHHGRYPLGNMYLRNPDELTINHDKITASVHVGSVPKTQADIKRISALGFGAILDLCGDSTHEKAWAEAQGIDFLHEFVHDGYSPTQEQFRSIVDWIHAHAVAGRKVYVHCHAGAGRAPTAVTAYLIYASKLSTDEALGVLKEKRRYHIVSSYQKLGLRTFEQYIRKPS